MQSEREQTSSETKAKPATQLLDPLPSAPGAIMGGLQGVVQNKTGVGPVGGTNKRVMVV